MEVNTLQEPRLAGGSDSPLGRLQGFEEFTARDAEYKCQERHNQAHILLRLGSFLLVLWLPSTIDFYGLLPLYFSHKPHNYFSTPCCTTQGF